MLIWVGSGRADTLLKFVMEGAELMILIGCPTPLDCSCCRVLAVWGVRDMCYRRMASRHGEKWKYIHEGCSRLQYHRQKQGNRGSGCFPSCCWEVSSRDGLGERAYI